MTGTDSGADSDSDSKLDGYIVLCRTRSHCTDSDSDPYSLFLYRQESESESVPESIFGNINEPLGKRNYYSLVKLFYIPE